MLQEFNQYIYELNSIYVKELNLSLVFDYILNFYNSFIENNQDLGGALLQKTAQIIIIATDDLLIQNSPIKEAWWKNTAENKIFHTNRGGEILDSLIEDVLHKRIINGETISILITLLLLGTRSPLKSSLLEFYKESKNFYNTNIENHLQKASLQKNKKPPYKFLHLLLMIGVFYFVITELHYFIRLQQYTQNTNQLMLHIRSFCGFQ